MVTGHYWHLVAGDQELVTISENLSPTYTAMSACVCTVAFIVIQGAKAFNILK